MRSNHVAPERVDLRFVQSEDHTITTMIFQDRRIIEEGAQFFTPDRPIPTEVDVVLGGILNTVLTNNSELVKATPHSLCILHNRPASSMEAIALMGIRNAGYAPHETAKARRAQSQAA